MLPVLLALALADEPTWHVDPTSLSPAVGSWLVKGAVFCPPISPDDPLLHGASLHTLAVAVVVYSRKQATMGWGHASVRAITCRDGEPHDAEYEAYRMGPGNMGEVTRVLEGEAVLSDEAYLDSQKGALFRFRNDDPVDAGFYAQSHGSNREIYELWLSADRAELDRMVLHLEERLDDQLERLRGRLPLQGRYRVFSTNCTVPIQEILGHPEWAMPFRWLRELEDDAQLLVVHPSEHLARRWGAFPDIVGRPRPLFRRKGEIPTFAGWSPVLPEY